MICKECGAYNPDHATFCKVCAASLKGEPIESAPADNLEEDRPTQRFVRPSWSVPVASQPKTDPVAEPDEPEELSEEIQEETSAAPVVEDSVVEDSTEEEPVVWTRPSRKTAPVFAPEEDDNDEIDEAADETEEDFEPDDEYEYEPTAPKKNGKRSKSNVLFWILLAAIIFVILCIIGVFVFALLDKDNGESGKGLFSCVSQDADETITDPENNPVESDPTDAPVVNQNVVGLEEFTDESGVPSVKLNVYTPAGYSMTVVLPNRSEDYVLNNTGEAPVEYGVTMAKSVFYPDAPLTEANITLTPEVYLLAPDGSRTDLEVPSFTETFPSLSIRVEAPVLNENNQYMAAEGNTIAFKGTVDSHEVTLYVNGTPTTVYEGGVFMFDHKLAAETAETVTLKAEMKNAVSTETTFTIEPYVFIPDPMVLTLTTTLENLKADTKQETIAVTGTTLPGATLTAVSDDTEMVLCDSVAVDANGTFNFKVTLNKDFYGISNIKLSATKDGAENGEIEFFVSRSYSDKDEFVDAYDDNYLELNRDLNTTEFLANMEKYATSAYGYRINAETVEAITDGEYSYIKMTLKKTGETVYVLNLSSKWAPHENIGKDYRVYGNCIGTYEDTGCLLFIGWFAKTLD